MSILTIIIAIAVVGFIAWLLTQIPMPQPFRSLIIGIMIFLVVIWLLQQLGVMPSISALRIK